MPLSNTIEATQGLVNGMNLPPKEDIFSFFSNFIGIISGWFEKIIAMLKGIFPEEYTFLATGIIALIIGYFIGRSVQNGWTLVRGTVIFAILIFLLISFAGGN